ncbi:hypothetical protein K501DRAFT_265578 [Backusella circina FSU 941]|nr:hypothetical protein K501DRAFT_265578 [Backusella circina FSU 941]
MEYDYFQIPIKSSDDKESLYSVDESLFKKNNLTPIPHTSWLEWKRPSFLTHISTAYTHKPSAILLEISEDTINRGRLLCAKKMKLRNTTGTLRWKEYEAILSPTQLELHSLSNKKHAIFKRKHTLAWKNTSEPFQLSLMSSIDFSWKLESKTVIFYFQSENTSVSQEWYRALYKALPLCSKKPLPLYVDLWIPELANQICIPLGSLETNENAELVKVRESALTLLHRHGYKPDHWNSRTVGLCWNNGSEIDWVLAPNQLEISYLIEPRLIEKSKKTHMVTLFDHYLLVQNPATRSWRNCYKSTEPDQDDVLSSAKYAFDLSRNEEKEVFPFLKYDQFLKTSKKKIKKSGTLYVKSTDRCTFEQRTCLLSTDGILGVFRSNHTKEITVKHDYYIYSGECCRSIAGLPAQWACRIFKDGVETSSDAPYRCAFIVRRHSDQKEYIFLARNIKEKEQWLLALVNHKQ